MTQPSFHDIKPVDLTPLICYQLYNSIKLHFTTPSFNFLKYGLCEKKFTQKSLDANKNSAMFYKISDKFLYRERYVPLLVANFFSNPNMWVGEMLSEVGAKAALEHRKYTNTLYTSFGNDIQRVSLKYRITNVSSICNLESKTNFFTLLTRKEIHPITAAILCKFYFTKYSSNSIMSFVYEDKVLHLNKLYDVIPSVEEARILDVLTNSVSSF